MEEAPEEGPPGANRAGSVVSLLHMLAIHQQQQQQQQQQKGQGQVRS